MFIDANIFIMAMIGKDRTSEKCRDYMHKIENGEQQATTSVLVLDEVLHNISEYRGTEIAIKFLKKISVFPNLEICEITLSEFNDSLKFVNDGLRPRDALHVAVMRANGVSTILSFDKDFDGVKEIERKEP